jgi:hypothetical protein
MNRTVALILLISGSAALTAPERSWPFPQTQQRRIDSLLLVRTACAGSCPAYRLSLAATGVVRFHTDLIDGRDSLSPGRVDTLLARVERIGFFSLPDSTRADRTMCAAPAAGLATVSLTAFTGALRKTVTDYAGCFDSRLAAAGVSQASSATRDSALVGLRGLHEAIDSLTLSGRWLHPLHPPSFSATWIGTVSDSIVLQRPDYRVRLTNTGDLRFSTIAPRPKVVSDTIRPTAMDLITVRGEVVGFFDLPDSLRADRYFCPAASAGTAPVSVTFYRGAARRSVVDDLRCVEPVDRRARMTVTGLRNFQAYIDTVLGTARWTNR